MRGSLSQSNGIAAASSTSSSSILAHAAPRASLPFTSSAAAIAALIFGTSVWPQLTLPVDSMCLPLKVMFSTVCGSEKSAIQPTLGHTSISSLGTLQYFAYMVDCSTTENLVTKPRFFIVWLTISASSLAGGLLEPTITTGFVPVYLPLG